MVFQTPRTKPLLTVGRPKKTVQLRPIVEEYVRFEVPYTPANRRNMLRSALFTKKAVSFAHSAHLGQGNAAALNKAFAYVSRA